MPSELKQNTIYLTNKDKKELVRIAEKNYMCFSKLILKILRDFINQQKETKCSTSQKSTTESSKL